MRKTLITIALLGTPRAALACPVCFGQNDSPLAVAMNQGILLMLGVVALVLGAFASFFIVLIRRAKTAEQPTRADATRAAALRQAQGIPSLSRDEASRYVVGEGTAQC
ncbi:MAG: hypothetical protein HY047_09505 [Acidobacteria bacterium]|nr:hypothetical protein [Acidobacteriota bacterium]